MYVDVHNHCLPEPYVDLLLEWDTPVGLVESDGALFMVHERSGTASVRAGNRIPLNEGFTEVDVRLEWMAEHDIETSVVSVSTPNPLAESFTPEQSTKLVRAINDGYARLHDRHPDAIVGLGMLPLREPAEAVEEVDRIADESSLGGIALPTSVAGRKLSADVYDTVFEAIDDRGLSVFIHPHGNVLSDTLATDESFLNPLVVFPLETTFQVVRLIYDGFFDRHDFEVVLSHMGGALLQLAGRFDRGRREINDPDSPPTRSVLDYLQRFYYDVISFHQPALAAAVETVGVEQLVFGTDYPFDEEDTATIVADLEAVVESESDRRRIASTTAQELFEL